MTAPAAVNPDEVEQVKRDIEAVLPEPAPPRPPSDRATAEPATPTAGEQGAELLEDLAERAEREPEKLAAHVADLTEDELQSVIELGFGMVADARGPHWDISEKRAARLAKWSKRVLERHPVGWLAQYLPELVCALLFGYEIWARLEADKKLAGKGGADASAL